MVQSAYSTTPDDIVGKIMISLSMQFKCKYAVQLWKTFLFRSIQFSQTALIQTIQFSISMQFSSI